MMHALKKKLTQGPGIIKIRTNEGTLISTSKALKRVHSARFQFNCKNQDQIYFPKYLKSESSGAETAD